MMKWGFIGSGNMAAIFANAMRDAQGCIRYMVLGSSQAKSQEFAQRFDFTHYAESLEEMLSSEVDIIYIATRHPEHFALAKAAIQAKKHLLCEKPLTISTQQTIELVQLAKANNVLLLEGFMYRFHPQTKLLVELLSNNIIGQVRTIVCGYSGQTEFDPKIRLFNPQAAGGSIWDVGGYPVSTANLIVSAINNMKPIAPIKQSALGILAENGVDLNSALTLIYPNNIIARLNCGAMAREENRLVIYGESGKLIVETPWVYNRTEAQDGVIQLVKDGEVTNFTVPACKTSFSYEAEMVAEMVKNYPDMLPEFPIMSSEESILQSEILEYWVREVGGITL